VSAAIVINKGRETFPPPIAKPLPAHHRFRNIPPHQRLKFVDRRPTNGPRLSICPLMSDGSPAGQERLLAGAGQYDAATFRSFRSEVECLVTLERRARKAL